VCTGNVCRSPYIERLLTVGMRGLDVGVSSAGTRALAGKPMDPGSARLLKEAGIGTDDFVARQLTPAMLAEADLVLTATREHRREVVQLEPKALRYTHAVDDFSDLVAAADLDHRSFLESRGAPMVAKLASRAQSARGEVAARVAEDSGIVDPFRQPDRVFMLMAQQVGEVLPRIVRAAHEVAVSC
jgi:Protein-tyrosine-phosphatase